MKSKGITSLIISAIVIIGLILINFIIQIGVNPSYKNMATDSGTFAYCGQVIRDGGLMYRDCWDNKPPGVYYLNALAIWLGGSNPFTIWLFQAIWLAIAIVIFFLLMHRIWENRSLAAIGSFATLVVLLYPDIFQGGNFTETYAILPVVLSFGAFWAYLRSGRRSWLVGIGLLTAAGFVLKPTYIAVGLAATMVVVYQGLRQRNYKSLWVNLAVLASSTLLPLTLVGLYWVFKQDFYELWFAVFAHNISYIQEGFSLQSLYGTARMFLINQPMAALTILAMMSVLAFIFQHRPVVFIGKHGSQNLANSFIPGQLEPGQARVWFMLTVYLSTALDVIFLASSGKNFGHYLQVLVPGMVVSLLNLLFLIGQSFRQTYFGHNLSVVALLTVIIVSLGGGLEIAAKELPSIRELRAFIAMPNLTVYQPTELEQYILDHSSPSDSVLIWAGHPGMNFVTHRRSPTKYIFLLHLFSPTPYGPNGFNEFMQELGADPPQLIVIQPVSSVGLPDITDPSKLSCANCDTLVQAGLSDLHKFVASRYELSFSIWDWVVYSRLR